MRFAEYLSTRWPRKDEVIAAIRAFRGEPESAVHVIRRLAAYRITQGRGSLVGHWERQDIHSDWHCFQKRQAEHESRTA